MTKPNSVWDPDVLFRGDEPSRPAPDQGASRERTIDLTPIAETVRELNQRRPEGIITDAELNTRKAELFERLANSSSEMR